MPKLNSALQVIKDNRVAIIGKSIQIAVVTTAYVITNAIVNKPATITNVLIEGDDTDGSN
jgi:hypothetical protein